MNLRIKSLKTGLLWLSFFVTYSPAQAQLNVVLKPVNPYRFQVEDVWNINISSSISAEVIVHASVRKSGAGEVYLTTSAPVLIKAGITSLSKIVLSSSLTNFRDPGIRTWVDAHGALPPGHYSICYSVSCVQPNCGGAGNLGSDNWQCTAIILETPSPLLLSSPGNESVIDDVTPLLTWIPPSPVSQEVTYELRLVKIQEGQSRQDAVSRNIPLLERQGISGVSLNYPPDLVPLQEGEHYAWEVYATLFGERIARSEVWEFSIGKDTIIRKEDPFNYIKIRQVNPSSVILVENTLRLDYHEMVSKSDKLQIEVLTDKGERKGMLYQPIVYGENLMQISLQGMGLKPGNEYTVRITNALGERYEIRIKYSFSY